MNIRNQYGQVARCADQTWETWGDNKLLLERDIARGLKGELSAILATQIGVGSRIIAKANLIFRPHLSSDIENQAKQCRFAKMALNAHGQIEDVEIRNALKLWSGSFCSTR